MFRFLRILCVGAPIFYVTPCAALDLGGADGLIDFDAAIGFTTPRTISVFRSADPADHLYHLIPNSVQLAPSSNGRPNFGLVYTTDQKKMLGYMTFVMSPVLQSEELQAIIDEIRQSDSQARFGIPTPTQSAFYIMGPEFGRKDLSPKTPASNPLRTPSGFSVDISSIAIRASLVAESYKQPIFTIGHDFGIRGIARDERGEAQVVTRVFGTSFVMNGICALYPELVLDLTKTKQGCRAQSYPSHLIRGLQTHLKARGYDIGPVDGVFGGRTELAIRAYQNDQGLVVDGIPDERLRRSLRRMAEGL